MITQERLKELLDYDSSTGIFVWRKSRQCVSVGSIAGTIYNSYNRIVVDGKSYRAHRLAWLWVHGESPVNEIDHINGVCSDNRIDNLRLATRKQNNENNKLRTDNSSGYRGVHFLKGRDKWQARISHHNRRISLGVFDTAEEAAIAAKAAREQLFTHDHGRDAA